MATVSGDMAPAPRSLARRVLRPRLILVAGAALAIGLTAALAMSAQSLPTRGPTLACADVASAVGLNFSGAYGPVYPSTETVGQVMQRNLGNGAAVGDYDGDGYLDVFLLGQAGHASRLFRNVAGPNGTRQFVDVTTQAGLGGITSDARVAQFVDLSGDGRPDLVIASDYMPGGPGGPSQIFRNNGNGTFTNVTAGSGFDPTGYVVGGMTFADYNKSGLPSIYISDWTLELGGDPNRPNVIQGAFPGQNRLYENLGNYHFKDVTDSSGIGDYHGDSFTAIFADFTGDGLPDIYQADDHRPDRFYLNLGHGQFQDESGNAGLARTGNSMGVATEVGPNGGLDLYVTNITDPAGIFGSNEGNTFMISSQDATGIHFTNDAASHGIVNTAWGWGTAFVDMTGSGAPDLYAVQGFHEFVGDQSPQLANATSTLFMNDGTGKNFTSSNAPGCEVPGDQRALIVFDFNRDGAPDLLITQVDGPPILLENLISGKHWLTVAPTGPGDAGIDARVTVTAGGHTTTQIILAGGSYMAGPPREAYFGLGATTAADVTIAWANGETSAYHDVPAGEVLRAERP